MTKTPIPAVGYCRVSTEEQATEGLSLEAQPDKIRQWASLNGHPILEIMSDDGISGKAAHNRPGLNKALELVLANKGVLVVYSLSRLSRSTRDVLDISERLSRGGAEFVSIAERFDTTTAAGKMFFRVMAVLNEFERDVISERTVSVLNHKRTKGEALGNTPYGFRSMMPPGDWSDVDPARRPPPMQIVNESERTTLLLMMDLACAGSSCGAIASRLDELHMPPRWYYTLNEEGKRVRHTANGEGRWSRGSVLRIIKFYRTPRGQQLLATLKGSTT